MQGVAIFCCTMVCLLGSCDDVEGALCPFEPGDYELRRTVVENTCSDYTGPITPLSRSQLSMADNALGDCEGRLRVPLDRCSYELTADCGANGLFSGEFMWISPTSYEGTLRVEHVSQNCYQVVEYQASRFP